MENWQNIDRLLLLSRQMRDAKIQESELLISSVMSKNTESIISLLLTGISINAHNGKTSPLIYSVVSGDEEMCDFLISRGAIVDFFISEINQDSVIAAVENSKTNILKKIIPLYKLENAKIPSGETALILAVKNSDAASVEILLTNPFIKVNRTDSHNRTPIYYNLNKHHRTDADADIFRMLISAGAQKPDSNEIDATQLHAQLAGATPTHELEAILSSDFELENNNTHDSPKPKNTPKIRPPTPLPNPNRIVFRR